MDLENILKKIKNKQPLTNEEQSIVNEVFKEQHECIQYYSQNFAGVWDNDTCNVNWRAKKCTDNIQKIVDESAEVIDVDKVDE